jgi:iron(III) transport system ATP-binding protein
VIGGGPESYRVGTPLGEFHARSSVPLRAGDAAVLSVRPEDIDVLDARPSGDAGTNVCEGTVLTRVFLGECVDFEVRVGEQVLIARGRPSVRAGVGEPLFLRLDPEKSIAVPDSGDGQASAGPSH